MRILKSYNKVDVEMIFRCLCSGSQANHGGGYQYRLCPKGQPLTEVLETFMFNTFLMADQHILLS